MKKTDIILLFGLVISVPIQTYANTVWLNSVFWNVYFLINDLLWLLSAVATLFFVWGVVKYIFNSGDQKTHEEGKKMMFWGIVALFVIIGVWGLVALIQEATGIGAGSVLPAPQSG